MGTVHQIRPLIVDDLDDDNPPLVDEPEHGDGDDDASVVMCSICKWWQPNFESEGMDGVPIRGTCRYDPPPWVETSWDDWCRQFEADPETE